MPVATLEHRLERYCRFGVKLGLDNMRAVCAAMGDPQRATPAIHIAGTNGKGSTTATVASILRAANYPAGRYTSPHLCSPTERIAVDGIPITDRALMRALDAVDRAAEAAGCDTVTYFEMLTLAAFHIFKKRLLDAAVYEVGLGGRLDATNVLEPKVTAIITVARDHVMHLGEEIAQIAGEKAGIIKEATPVICGDLTNVALEVIRNAAASRNAPLLVYGQDFGVRGEPALTPDGFQSFVWWGPDGGEMELRTPLHGRWQAHNTACAVTIVQDLIRQGWNIKPDAIVRGVERTQWPGRMEWLRRDPGVLFDCAHNVEAMQAVLQTVRAECPVGMLPVLAVLDDKEAPILCALLASLSDRIVVSASDHPRALAADALADLARPHFAEVVVEPDLETAIAQALDPARPLFVVGSLMNYAEAKRAVDALAAPAA